MDRRTLEGIGKPGGEIPTSQDTLLCAMGPQIWRIGRAKVLLLATQNHSSLTKVDIVQPISEANCEELSLLNVSRIESIGQAGIHYVYGDYWQYFLLDSVK